MGSQLAGELGLVAAAGDGDGVKAHPDGELHRQMTEAADAQDADEVAGAGTAVAQRIEGGDPGAEQRAGLDGRELVRDQGQRLDRGHHVLGIAAIVADAGYAGLAAGDEIAAAAAVAMAAMPAIPADADPLPDLPGLGAVAQGVDHAGDLVAGDPG